MDQEKREQVIARLMHKNGAYWLYHKNLIDENIDSVLEKKPEEKIWRVVRDNRCPEMEMPCYRLMKKDLIKVGRVRFKIRDIMSPVYREIENGVDLRQDNHREMYPSVIDDTLSMDSSIIHPETERLHLQQPSNHDDAEEEDEEEPNEDPEMAGARRDALLTESEHDSDEEGEGAAEDQQEEGQLAHANTHFPD